MRNMLTTCITTFSTSVKAPRAFEQYPNLQWCKILKEQAIYMNCVLPLNKARVTYTYAQIFVCVWAVVIDYVLCLCAAVSLRAQAYVELRSMSFGLIGALQCRKCRRHSRCGTRGRALPCCRVIATWRHLHKRSAQRKLGAANPKVSHVRNIWKRPMRVENAWARESCGHIEYGKRIFPVFERHKLMSVYVARGKRCVKAASVARPMVKPAAEQRSARHWRL